MKSNKPKKMIFRINGKWVVTKNFDSDAPAYKKYKKLSKALRYINVSMDRLVESLANIYTL